MSNGRRHRRRISPHHEPWVAIQAAGTADDDPELIEDAKRRTHDSLIAQLGAARRGGVRWAIYGPDERDAALDLMTKESVLTAATYTGLADWFTEHPGGCLVVAGAEAVR